MILRAKYSAYYKVFILISIFVISFENLFSFREPSEHIGYLDVNFTAN